MTAEHLAALAGLALMHLLAAATPGPNIVAVSYFAAAQSRRRGLEAAAGIVLASLIWVTLCLLGVGALLVEAGWLYRLLRLAGAAYLVYFGARMLLAAWRQAPASGNGAPPRRAAQPPFMAGLLTTLGNPKSAVFWTSLFVVAVPPDAGAGFYVAILAVVLVQSTLWYTGVALLLSTGAARRVYARAGRWLDAATGAVMVALGLRLADDLRR